MTTNAHEQFGIRFALIIFFLCFAIAWTLLFITAVRAEIPRSGVVRERVDCLEDNWFYDDEGKLVFRQLIFLDWSDDDARYMVRAWRLIKHPSQLPQRDWRAGGYVTVWQDGELMRRVRSKSARETWTQFDPELIERDWLPKDRRAELVSLRVKRPQPSQAAFDDFQKFWTTPPGRAP